jgi:hypothetical protein
MQGRPETNRSTEDLRAAMVRYRIVFEDLLTAQQLIVGL